MDGELQDIGEEAIKNESPERMFKLIRLCHPNEHGEPYGRGDIIEEFKRRGMDILLALDWPTEPEAVYKNRYTGGEETLAEMKGIRHSQFDPKDFEAWLQNESWSIIEHWWPIKLWVPDDLLGKYKENPTLNKFFGTPK